MSRVVINTVDNGWVVEYDYDCYGGKASKVYTVWADVVNDVSYALRQPLIVKATRKR